MGKPIGTDEMLDRIEQLAAINEELEAKLAKALELVEEALNIDDDGSYYTGWRSIFGLRQKLKGQDNE